MLSNTTSTHPAHLGHTDGSTNFITGAGYNYTVDTPLLGNIDSSNPWQGVTASDNNLTIKNNNNFTIKNNNDMNVQAKIAIFEVTRNDKGIINSSIFKLEFWIEKKNGVSIDLAAAKYLPDDFDPDLIIVKELYSATF